MSLKYRVWNKSKQKFTPFSDYKRNSDNCRVLLEPDGNLVLLNEFGELHLVEDCVVQRLTGLKDKNGKDIYEGDIVGVNKYEWNATHIVNGKKYCEVCLVDNDILLDWQYDECSPLEHYQEYEILGNIFENPEFKHE